MTPSAAPAALQPGFAEPALDAQRVFRAVLAAMSRPGSVHSIDAGLEPPAPLSLGSAALCLTLADLDTPLWLDGAMSTEPVAHYLRFHCGARIVASPGEARFALIADGGTLPALEAFDRGCDEYPERSATLLIQVRGLCSGESRRLSGPGIADRAHLAVAGLADGFWREWRVNRALFPRGVDVVLVAGDRIAALPRTTEAEG